LAEVYQRQKRFAEAETLFLRAIEINEALMRTDQHIRKVPVRQSGISLYYGKPAADLACDLNNLALLYDSQGMHEKAVFYFERAITVAPSALILRNFGATLRQLGLEQRADEVEARAEKIDSSPRR
jgi:tetratricopeptide (TPR) repeat protein